MKISLKFLQNRLSAIHIQAKVLLNNLRNPVFDALTVFTGQFAQSETLYFCPPSTSRDVFRGIPQDADIGIVWVDERVEPPRNVPVLWLQDAMDSYALLNEICGIFTFYRRWSTKVRQYILERRNLSEIFELLNDVTPNPWYLSDCSFRMQVIRKDQDMEDMSVIWRYQYQQGHLPIQIILGIEENGLLDLMNKMRHAFIVSEPEPFGFTFVSKTITYSSGIMGHFYILGTYTKLSEYEVEIAEFFGNVLTELLRHDSAYLPTRGRFYDNYFTDMLEGINQEDLDMLEKVFRKIAWNVDSSFYLAVLGQQDNTARPKSMLDLEIQVLESQISCKAFLYHEEIVVLVNGSKLENSLMAPVGELIQQRILNVQHDFGGAAGISERFTGQECFERLRSYYQQAHTALQFALRREAPFAICSYTDIAIAHLCEELAEFPIGPLFMHPAVAVLKKYDEDNRTELAPTLYKYLICGENVVRTAGKLFIHRNSLMYRLDKIHQLTDVDLSDFGEKVRIFLTFNILDNIHLD